MTYLWCFLTRAVEGIFDGGSHDQSPAIFLLLSHNHFLRINVNNKKLPWLRILLSRIKTPGVNSLPVYKL